MSNVHPRPLRAAGAALALLILGALTGACAEVTRYLGAAAPSPVLEDQ